MQYIIKYYQTKSRFAIENNESTGKVSLIIKCIVIKRLRT